MPIENVSKGAVIQPRDDRDLMASVAMGTPQVNWAVDFMLKNPGDEDQGQSLSCVAQAWSYYHNQIRAGNYSRRDLYSRIYLPNGGAYIRDGGKQLVTAGQDTRDHMPDPTPETEAGMRDSSGRNPAVEALFQEADYFSLSNDIDTVAAAIEQYSGVVFGLTGSNPGWQDMENPRPPASGEATWGHALYAMGHHLHDGVKCITAKSSWCNEVPVHHIKENYFLSGNTFNPWTLIKKEQQAMVNKFKVVKGQTLGIMILESLNGSVLLADSMAHYNELVDAYQIPADAPTINLPA